MKRNSTSWQPHISWGGLIFEAANKLKKNGLEALHQAGLDHLSYGRIGVMALIHTQAQTQAELAKALHQKQSSMKEFLHRLEKEKLVTRNLDPKDSRKKLWSLTAKGKKDFLKAKELTRRQGKKIDRAFSKIGVNKKKISEFKNILKALVESGEI